MTKIERLDILVYFLYLQVCDPRITADFWQTWKEFEVRHGNEDTMREMLRIKRSVQATYNTQVNMMAAQFLNTNNDNAADGAANGGRDAMHLLEEKARQAAAAAAAEPKQKPAEKALMDITFVRGETQGGAKKNNNTVVNPDEIDIGDSEEEDEDEDEENAGAEQAVDASAATKTDDEGLIMKKLRFEQKAIPAKVFGSLKTNNHPDSDEE